MNKKYFNIHSHTMFSNTRVLDSTLTPKTLIDTAIAQGLSGIALTDHGLLSGHVQFEQYYNSIKEANPNFKIGLGCEIYLTDTREKSQKYYHFLLTAKNFEGYKLLREISSTGWINGYWSNLFRIPVLKSELKEIVSKAKGNLIATTACLGGELPTLVKRLIEAQKNGLPVDGIQKEIIDFITYCKDLFGDDFYIEVAPSDDEEQIAYNSRVINIANYMNVKMIYATDAHYARPENATTHSLYLNSQGKEREVASFYKYTYVMSHDEAAQLLEHSLSSDTIEQMRKNTLEIQDKIESYTLAQEQRVRKAPIVEPDWNPIDLSLYPTLNAFVNDKDSIDNRFFVKTCINSLKDLGLLNGTYLARLEEEADILHFISERLEQDLTAYLNFLSYYIDMFWEAGSMVGPGRGSAVGFLSAMCLGITQVDPVKYELPAFRFLNKERAELPDIDIDLAPSKKPHIIAELRKLLGEFNVLSVATFGTEKTRSALLSVCRGYRSAEYPAGVDVDTAQYLTSLIPSERGFLWSLADVAYGDKSKGRKPVKEFINTVSEFPGLLDAALEIEGTIKQAGLHAAGVVFFQDDIYDTCAIMRAPSGELCTQSSLHDAEFEGNLKFDFLVISMLDKMTETLKLLSEDNLIDSTLSLREQYNKYLHPNVLDLDDKSIWTALKNNDVVSVFQFDSPVGIKGARECAPVNIYELTNTNALIRLMSDSGESPMARFVRMKNDISQWYSEMDIYGLTTDEQKTLEKYYLRDSGTPATQEVVMLALMDKNICGMTLGEVNKVRKIIAKKDMNEIPKLKKRVYDVAVSNQMAEYIWKTLVEPQLGYAFSLLHSLAYSFIGVQSLILGTHYPAVYWQTANLITDSGGSEEDAGGADYGKIAKSIGTFTRVGVKVSLPDINKSKSLFSPVAAENRILYGLNAISGVSSDFAKEIIKNRPYDSVEHFMQVNKPNKTQMISLIKSGAFDSMVERNKALEEFFSITANLKTKLTLANIPKLMEYDLLPDELFSFEKRLINFNIHLRANQEFKADEGRAYKIDGPYEVFYNEYLNTDLLLHNGSVSYVTHKDYDKHYKVLIDPVKRFIAASQKTLLDGLNSNLLLEECAKYSSGHNTFAEMEVDVCGFMNSSDHWLFDLDLSRYGISHFEDLSELPNYENSFFTKTGREVKLAKIEKTIGVVVHKIADKGLFYLLDDKGVFEVKMPREQFAAYDKQISEIGADGKKTVVSKSIFTRGNVLAIMGYRNHNVFHAKKYKNMAGHTISRLIEVDDAGKLILDGSREY